MFVINTYFINFALFYGTFDSWRRLFSLYGHKSTISKLEHNINFGLIYTIRFRKYYRKKLRLAEPQSTTSF